MHDTHPPGYNPPGRGFFIYTAKMLEVLIIVICGLASLILILTLNFLAVPLLAAGCITVATLEFFLLVEHHLHHIAATIQPPPSGATPALPEEENA